MSRALNLVGKRFGRLTVIKRLNKNKWGEYPWLCKCDCGNETIGMSWRMRNGDKQSCGCLQKEAIAKVSTRHNLYGIRLHTTWRHMKERCNNPNSTDYHNYGGRGITYYQEWEEFKPFYEWAMKNGYKDDLTIDRIDVNGNYEPSNCRWVSRKKQGRNKRDTIRITIDGVTKTIPEWSEKTGVQEGTLRWRYYNGIKGKDIICTKDRRGKRSLV